MHIRSIVAVVAVAVAVAVTCSANVASAQDAAAHGHGRLRITAEPPGAPPADVPANERQHHITVHLTRSADAAPIHGPVTIKGVAAVASAEVGDVDWQVSGANLSGSVTHPGNAVTTFDGTITSSGASGTFTLPGGARGEWSWDGPLPQ
jgi:hypothetical protein